MLAAGGDELAKVGVARLVFSQQGQVNVISQRDFGAEDGVQTGALRRPPETHDARQRVVVGQRQPSQPQFDGVGDQFFRRRDAIQQREIAVTVQLSVLTHPLTPDSRQSAKPQRHSALLAPHQSYTFASRHSLLTRSW